MDVGIVNLVIAVAVLVLFVELDLEHLNKRIRFWESSHHQSLSALATANNNSKITKEDKKKEADEINKQLKHVSWLRKSMKVLICIRQVLPILLTIEVGLITLQSFQWLPPLIGLNKGFLILIITITLFYFIIRIISNDKKILEYELYNTNVIAEYKFGFQLSK